MHGFVAQLSVRNLREYLHARHRRLQSGGARPSPSLLPKQTRAGETTTGEELILQSNKAQAPCIIREDSALNYRKFAYM